MGFVCTDHNQIQRPGDRPWEYQRVYRAHNDHRSDKCGNCGTYAGCCNIFHVDNALSEQDQKQHKPKASHQFPADCHVLRYVHVT